MKTRESKESKSNKSFSSYFVGLSLSHAYCSSQKMSFSFFSFPLLVASSRFALEKDFELYLWASL